jgi:hypothetical protein
MNSPMLGTSGTGNVTSRMTVSEPNRLVTFLKSTMFGRSPPARPYQSSAVRYGNSPRWNHASSRSMP